MSSDEPVSLNELILANNIELDAVVKILIDKGIITEAELLDAIREMKQHMLGRGKLGSA